jgi:hypothetical protein
LHIKNVCEIVTRDLVGCMGNVYEIVTRGLVGYRKCLWDCYIKV